MGHKYLILMITFATVEINLTESRHNYQRRFKNTMIYPESSNICLDPDRKSKVHCYCDIMEVNSATEADCWVFNGGIAQDDPLWSDFYSQPKIEKLNFNVRTDGALSYIPGKVIVRLENLQYFNLQYGNIFAITAFAFTNSTSLRGIALTKNKIVKLEKMAFAHLLRLSNLTLAENQISEVNRDVFYYLPNLQRLYLSENSISVLHDGCFKHLTNLVRLDLDNNLLTVVIRENFQGLSNLIRLNMRNNKLTLIGDQAFAELWSLQELYLDGNEILYIDGRGFGGMTQLRKLSLADNKLDALDEGVLNDNRKLTVLDLRYNNLETLQEEAVQNILENMKTSNALISLGGNKLSCDCRLSWLHKLRNETKSKRIKVSLKRLVCIMDIPKNIKPNTIDIEVISKTEPTQTTDLDESKNSYDDNEADFDEDGTDDEDQDTELESKTQYQRKFLEIPTDMLPCSNRLTHDASYSPPTQDEVKYYKTSTSVKLRSINWLPLLTMALYCSGFAVIIF